MAERNQIGGALGAHDAGQPRGGQHVALLAAAGADQRQRLGRDQHRAFGGGGAMGDRLFADVDHPGLPLLVEMSEIAHYIALKRRARIPCAGLPRQAMLPVRLRLSAARACSRRPERIRLTTASRAANASRRSRRPDASAFRRPGSGARRPWPGAADRHGS